MKRWTKSETEILRKLYGTMRAEDMGINGRSAFSIRWKAESLGLKSKRGKFNRRSWTPEQDMVLRDNYGTISAYEIGKLVGRKEKSVYMRAFNLGITLPPKGRFIKRIEISQDIIDRYYAGATLEDFCKELGACDEIVAREFRRAGVKIRTFAETSEKGRVAAMATVRGLCKSGMWGKIVSASHQGIPLHEWRGFRMPDHHRLMSSPEWKKWRIQVFRRDHFTCAMCSDKPVEGHRITIDPHHIVPKREAPGLTFDVDNGITLCRPCHRSIACREHLFAEQFKRHVEVRNHMFNPSKNVQQLRLGI